MASKFDNRLKEFAERWEVDRYLAATGYLHANIKPFFVALPKVQLQRAIFDCTVGRNGRDGLLLVECHPVIQRAERLHV